MDYRLGSQTWQHRGHTLAAKLGDNQLELQFFVKAIFYRRVTLPSATQKPPATPELLSQTCIRVPNDHGVVVVEYQPTLMITNVKERKVCDVKMQSENDTPPPTIAFEPVFLLAGQSNMAARCDEKDLLDGATTASPVAINFCFTNDSNF